MNTIGNFLMIENFNINEFKETEQKDIRVRIGDPTANMIYSKDQLSDLIRWIGLENTCKRLREIHNHTGIHIHRDTVLSEWLIESHFVSAASLCISIYRIHHDVKNLWKTIELLEMMGYEMKKAPEKVIQQVKEEGQ